jgi:hypothetical protein
VSFREPTFLAALAILPLALLLYAAVQRRRREAAAAFASPALMPNVVTATPGWRRHVPAPSCSPRWPSSCSPSRAPSARSPSPSARRR